MKPAPLRVSFMQKLAPRIESWFLQNARELPWRRDRSPYTVWLSEIMLQQTQVDVVAAYFLRFTAKFPTVESLAAAPEDDVLALWSGLGYYSRARNLHKTAKLITNEYAGEFPSNIDELLKLPGIGSYTAGAICAFAFDKPAPVVDGNISRVLSRLFDDDTPSNSPAGKKRFEAISQTLVKEASSPRLFQEGIMELGAVICKKSSPRCDACPVSEHCLARAREHVDIRPVRVKPITRQDLDVIAVVLYNSESICLERRDKKSLYGGLYEPPSAPLDGQTHRAVLAAIFAERNLPKGLLPTGEPIVVRRTLTHRNLAIHAYPVDADEQSYPAGNWVPIVELDRLGISKATRVVLEHVLSCSMDRRLFS